MSALWRNRLGLIPPPCLRASVVNLMKLFAPLNYPPVIDLRKLPPGIAHHENHVPVIPYRVIIIPIRSGGSVLPESTPPPRAA